MKAIAEGLGRFLLALLLAALAIFAVAIAWSS
jgi:hypothetical protein